MRTTWPYQGLLTLVFLKVLNNDSIMNAQVQTAGEGEGDDDFNFNQWILSNDITELKDKLEEHGLINKSTISIKSPEFNAFISDPLILSTKAHLLPKLFAAINKIPKHELR